MSLSEKYLHILQHVKETALAAQRQLEDIIVVAVSKNHSVNEILSVYQAGCQNFGENRLQEALPKMEALPKQIHWHFIGTLQKNKVNKVVGQFALIHSVDSLDLAKKIAEVSVIKGVETSILLQVNTSGEQSKHGFTSASFLEALEELASLPNIHLEGLMTMAPLEASEEEIHIYFRRLRELRDQAKRLLGDSHTFKHLSMGMSHDYTIAIEEGATLIRIGTAIFS